ncbi:MAG: ATP-binding protein [Pseudomonadota bacterium]
MPRYDADWFQDTLNAMHDMMLVKGPRSNLLWANKAFLDYYGMTEAELIDMVDADHSDPDATLQYVIDDKTVVDTGQSLDIPQEPVTDAHGNVRLFHTIKSPVFEGQTVTRTVGIARLLEDTDIPTRHINHDDAKAFVAPLQVLTRSFPNPMMMVDVQARVIQKSPLWEATFGAHDVKANSFFEDAYPGLTALSQGIDACLRTGESRNLTVTYPADDSADDQQGRIYTMQISPWAFSDGVIGGVTVIATDVTGLHDKTRDLQSANDELTQYAYRASHDLKGPISTVKGLAGLIMEDIADGAMDEAVDSTRKIITMMERLDCNVKSLLDLARADLDGGEACTVDLSQLLSEICEGLSGYSTRAGVAIENNLDVRHLRSQPVRLRQIIENLIANSIRYHAPDRDEKFVRVRSMLTDAGVAIEVADNGRGIPKEAGNRIFDRFTRFNQDSIGSGLGLAIVKKNVDALSGHIDVKSSDAGTAICVTVPDFDAKEARQ